jgi:DNA replication protein DnaC
VFELPALPGAIHTLSNEDSDRLKREFGEALATSPEDCRTCYGTGTFRWYVRHHPEEIVEFKCPCEDQWILSRFLLNCGIEYKYQRFDWHDLAVSMPPRILDYLKNAKQIIDAGLGLVLYGSEGTGKTLLAVLLLKTLIGRGHDGYFTSYSDMIQRFHEGRYDREEREWFLRRMTHASVLVIDDIGREQIRRTLERAEGRTVDALNSTAEFLFEDVIRHRVAMSCPTFITSNLALSDLATKYGSNVMSLLEEQAIPVELTGADWRIPSRERAEQEVRDGLRRPVVL